MQKITLLSIGKVRTPWIADGCAEYAKRLKTAASLLLYELPPGKSPDPARQRDDESGRILETARKLKGEIIVLDETGTRVTSAQFAEALAGARDTGTHLIFLLGGAYGFSDSVRQAGKTLRLSDMTFPHELCRLLFLEQLYRAGEINRGSGYHH